MDTLALVVNDFFFINVFFYHQYILLHTRFRKNIQVKLYQCLFIIKSIRRISCCTHADQILPKLRPNLNRTTLEGEAAFDMMQEFPDSSDLPRKP